MSLVRYLGAAMLFASFAFAQFESATVLGTVRDSAQLLRVGVEPGARMELATSALQVRCSTNRAIPASLPFNQEQIAPAHWAPRLQEQRNGGSMSATSERAVVAGIDQDGRTSSRTPPR